MLRLMKFTEENKTSLIKELKGRETDDDLEIVGKVSNILSNVKRFGDKALIEMTKEFDGVDLKELEVKDEDLENAFKLVEKEFINVLEEAAENIRYYHENQKSRGYILNKEDGIYMGQRVIPLERVGVYVPGGTAVYPSSVLMNVIPAKVAGVKEIIMVTPPSKDGGINPYIAVAAKISGVDKIYKVGGAQGIGALAYGTETIEKVDKIVGPGNIFVAVAKRLVFGKVDIDMIAGPSEILVIADKSANAKYIAADLMSQAEHDKLASSIFLTTSMDLYKEVEREIERQVEFLERKEIIKESLKNYGIGIVCESIKECIEISNILAPEHLEIMTDNPMELLGEVKNAGSIFLGHYSPEPIGDYFAGTNHVLPTNGTAKFFSPLSVDSFVKKSSYLHYTKDSLKKHGEKIILFAKKEGLTAHSNSVKVRLD